MAPLHPVGVRPPEMNTRDSVVGCLNAPTPAGDIEKCGALHYEEAKTRGEIKGTINMTKLVSTRWDVLFLAALNAFVIYVLVITLNPTDSSELINCSGERC